MSYRCFGFSPPEGFLSPIPSPKEVPLDDPDDPRGRTWVLVHWLAAGLLTFVVTACCIGAFHALTGGNLGETGFWNVIGIEAAGIFGFTLIRGLYQTIPAVIEAHCRFESTKLGDFSLSF